MIIDIPTVEGGAFIDGGPNKLGTIVKAEFLNSLMKSSTATTKEIETILKNAGIAPSGALYNQLYTAINKMIDNKAVTFKVLDSFGDSRVDAGSQRTINETNKSAKDAQTAANIANDKANQAKQEAYNAQQTADKKVAIYPTFLTDALLSTQYFGGFCVGVKGSAPLPADTPTSSAFKFMQIGLDAWPTQIAFDAYTNSMWIRTKESMGSSEMREWARMITSENIVQTAGTSIANIMSQKAVTDAITAAKQDIPPAQIFYFDSATPPAGFIARNGQAIDIAKMPKLFSTYGANMPDDRDRVHRMMGNLAGVVGTTQEDAIRNITGAFGEIGGYSSTFAYAAGALFRSNANNTAQANGNSSAGTFRINLDASHVVPTASENRVKSRIILACNKIQ